MTWFDLVKAPAKDKRYKLSAEDVNIIRQVREEGNSLNQTKQILKEKYGINISTATIMYWTNEESRNKQRLKNAKRKYVAGSKENKRRIANDGAKRKENWEADPDMKLRHKLQQAIDEGRSESWRAKNWSRNGLTVDGVYYTIDEAKKLIAEGSLKRPNRKLD